jgi:hypothetical protein
MFKTKLSVAAKYQVSLAGLSWPLFIGGQVSRIQSGSIQTRRIWQFIYQFSYSNTIQFDFYLGPIFLWAFTWIHRRGINFIGLGSHTLVSSPRDSISILDLGRISNFQIFDLHTFFDFFTFNLSISYIFYFSWRYWWMSLVLLTDQEPVNCLGYSLPTSYPSPRTRIRDLA